ncbi:MAG TPA: glycogen synthase GlgA [Anaeromyxobacter sp.]|nr:glycogen synthase GlgA [Anaeromyxobacter sp.]
MRVLFVSSEVAPFAKSGGLADVAGALPKALKRRGIDVRVVMPLYAGIDWNALERLEGVVPVPMWWGTARGGLRMGRLPGSDVPVYFLEYHRYFDRPFLYGPPEEGYGDNLERFTFLSRGALELCRVLNFTPDVIHAHDWQAALAPVYVNTVEWGGPLHGAGTVYTIHNLAYQGVTDGQALFITGLGPEHYHAGEFEHFGALNLMKAAIRHANLITTVSPGYAREIQTSEYGCGLDGELRARSGDLFGVLNGIDTEEWNPATDRHLPHRFSAADAGGKEAVKLAVQHQLGLAVDAGVPLFAAIGRLVDQKGFDVLAHAMERLLSWRMQFVLLATGDREAEHHFAWLSSRHRERFRAVLHFDNGLAHRLYAASDFVVVPSRFEPCGLTQLYGLRYGALPIVRATGGLRDTVQSYREWSGEGTGFVFDHLTPEALANTIGWALSTFYDRPEHLERMRRRAMEQDFSWGPPAEAYERLYREAYRRRRGHEP